MKVAQYEVLGWRLKNDPSRTGRSTATYAAEAVYERTRSQNTSIVPAGTGRSFLRHFPALRTGLLSSRPSGTSLLRVLLSLMLTRMGSRRTATEDNDINVESTPRPISGSSNSA